MTTPTEAFEAWWHQQLPGSPLPGEATPIYLAWFAACAWATQVERERCKRIALMHGCLRVGMTITPEQAVVGCTCRTEIATAIQEGK